MPGRGRRHPFKGGAGGAGVAPEPLRRILVALDGSPNSTRALDMALRVAAPAGASVTGIVSVKIRPRGEVSPGRAADDSDRDAAERVMKKAAERAAARGVTFVPKVRQGDTGYNIVKAAHSRGEPCDMVVIGSRGHGSLKQAFFGSTSNHVVHSSSIPVLVVK